jgi:uncharacterized repeat protein (TIGR01451 family)
MKMTKQILKFIPITGGAMFGVPPILTGRIRKTLSKFGLGLALSGIVTFSTQAAGGSLKTLPGHVPAAVSKLQALGSLPATTNLNLAIGLPLRNREALTNLLQQIYDPASPNYHHYLTPEEFTAQFGPTEQDYQTVINFARTNGLTVTQTHGNRMLLDVAGNVSDIERAFHVTMRTYRHPTEDRDFFAPDAEPSVDASVPILHVQGMNNYILPHPMHHKVPASGAKPAAGSGPGGGYMGQDFRNAYLPGGTLNGSGQMVGLLQFDGYYASDIATYESLAGLTNVPLQNVLLDGFNGVPGPNNDEVCLDIEMSISMAPALAAVVVFEAGPFGNPDDILSSMTSSNQIKQFSASWGYDIDATTEQLYQKFAVQGQTFFNASGDGDAWVGPIPYGSCEDPNITIVGGTTLTMSGNGAAYVSEKAWNWGFSGDYNWNPDGYAGTSGGISTDVSIPSWQQGINMTVNHGSTTMRNVPDVALTADNVFVVSSGGSRGIFGGTSCASPLWAGFMALVNQQAAANGQSSVGFLAPVVYALAETANYTSCFHDIVTGNNTWDQSPANFFAVPGYDLCTGLGTPNGINLINALAAAGNSVTHLSPPPPPYGTNLAALNGGNPNGSWQLFVQDNVPLDAGIISNGWILTLTTASPVGQPANLELLMTPSATNVLVGANLSFYIGVTNYGPSTSSNVMVSDTLPFDVTLVPTTPTQGSVSGLIWNVGTLTNGAGAEWTLTVRPNSLGTILNSAIASSDTLDPNPDDNIASTNVTVGTGQPQLLSGRFVSTNGTFQLTVNGQPGQEYIVQASTNLFNWVPVYTNPPPFVSPFTFIDSAASNYPDRFYRVVPGP